jgi:hypothetical protein
MLFAKRQARGAMRGRAAWLLVLLLGSSCTQHARAGTSTTGASSGEIFTGNRLRSYPKESIQFAKEHQLNNTCDPLDLANTKHGRQSSGKGPLLQLLQKYTWFTESKCSRWAVVTTIFAPTDSVKAASKWGDEWCLIVVADKKGFPADEYNIDKGIYLTVATQEEMATVSPFVAKLPWNHFGRKNVGYLVAALHGAAVVWDFDDDNELNEAIAPGPLSWVLDSATHTMSAKQLCQGVAAAFNPYPSMGATASPAWPRGFPLQHIKNKTTNNLAACNEVIEVRGS